MLNRYATIAATDQPARRGLPHRYRFVWAYYCIGFIVVLQSTLGFANPPDSPEYFEQHIRPVLVERCYGCHGADADEIGGSLWLDSANGMRTGGDSGPAIVPGDVDASILIHAIRYESSEMPPDQPLTKQQIQHFEAWIRAGAFDPRSDEPSKDDPRRHREIDIQRGRSFWAFRLPDDFRDSLLPGEPGGEGSVLIDQQIQRSLTDAGISPNDATDEETLLRRLSYDLTGLPPTDSLRRLFFDSPGSGLQRKTRVVDRLLSGRAFAEHWTRHWMDIARYADSNGSDFNATFHDAWRYRDYLIDAIAKDQPFDSMIRQQIAGDLLPHADDQQRYDNLVASTFLMLGPKMLSERDKPKLQLDVVDEQIDTVGRAFLGITMGCARCHDHKFDPIATEDYYALAGIFRSTQTLNGESQKYVSTWNKTPLPEPAELTTAREKHKQRLHDLDQSIQILQKEIDRAADNHGNLEGIIVDDQDATKTGTWKTSTFMSGFFGSGYVHEDNQNKGDCEIKFSTTVTRAGTYRIAMSYAHGGSRAAAVPITIRINDDSHDLTASQRKRAIDFPWQPLGTFDVPANAQISVTLSNAGTKGYVIADAMQFLRVTDDAEASIENISQSEIAATEAAAKAKRQQQLRLKRLKKERERIAKNSPPPRQMAMTPRDFTGTKIADSPVQIRGEPKNIGPTVRRGFPRVCSTGDAIIDSPVGSGRLALADWLTDPDNPLTARVFVNRVWMHLMGQGIVRSVDNFGQRGERPTHPELLDALAIDFMRDGWHIKSLVRWIVLSDTYARSSHHDDASVAIDPENRLLWRYNRRRIGAEAIRDTMLIAGNAMSTHAPKRIMNGRGVLVSKNNGDSRATPVQLDSPVR
ncbi:MAG: DUF1549 domain-containing protein, partial [Planctomycetota bacterium]